MAELRESLLLERIRRSARSLPPNVLVPPGDDMALIELGGRRLLAAVDQVVEGRHFISGTEEALIARKALARNLSDVAAMAVGPVATLAACTLPPHWDQSRAERLFDALHAHANDWHCPLIGGDIAVHAPSDHASPLVLAVTILAEPWPEAIEQAPLVVRRGTAAVGDGIFVTGRLGGSLGHDGRGRHLSFEPRVDEARALRRALGARLHSMIDVSDGLGRDAAALVGDGLRVVLDATAIPCHDGCSWQDALRDGEDHELCFATAGSVPSSVQSRDGRSTAITRIGEVRPREPAGAECASACVVRTERGDVDASNAGWEHGRHEDPRL